MTKDAEKLLKYIVEEAKSGNSEIVDFNIKEIKSIPNLSRGIKNLCNELKMCGYMALRG